ncbi:Scr1 family TA system antitoxin-like transcriptional regulator [Streptomyces sp. H10-C2]|uniref:Scr1 family TA system antitoxin-like transcriptional regulator n=1 Tax=unclassified Streptomyces TaxID=2593676 RepID=UPI0024B92476|nr:MULTISPECIES: Scr1 family TA system antitoxin-like transcriptional regulator [unclassified Streptomyces]MDJ0340588.1 Scr1 family TA system antitoxin-like transcriptional regulator [Streptomyces sp. PH10-H1]MDJ0370236.1 Scr1 family TA system antitoxin-like transcriptional regulator [Streptomyces sp. H10-C2]
MLPGLFQTLDYARALAVGCGAWEDPDEIDRFVEARIARQERLTRDNPIQVWAVISEAVLHQAPVQSRRVGRFRSGRCRRRVRTVAGQLVGV